MFHQTFQPGSNVVVLDARAGDGETLAVTVDTSSLVYNNVRRLRIEAVWVDDVRVPTPEMPLTVAVVGNVGSLTTSQSTVSVRGAVGGDLVSNQGSVSVGGNVGGNVVSNHGSVSVRSAPYKERRKARLHKQ